MNKEIKEVKEVVDKDSNDYWCTRCEEYKYWQEEPTKKDKPYPYWIEWDVSTK